MAQQDIRVQIQHVSELPEETRRKLYKTDDGIFRQDGRLYLPWGEEVISCSDEAEGVSLLRALQRGNQKKEQATGTLNSTWRDLLLSREKVSESLLTRLNLQRYARRNVIVFRKMQDSQRTLSEETLAELIPGETVDHVVRLYHDDLAVVLQTEHTGAEETEEFASAVIETVDEETGIQLIAGIGEEAEDCLEIHEACEKAYQALAIARNFHMKQRVYAYKKLMYERILNAIPEQERKKIEEEGLFHAVRRIINDEMKETVYAFFQNDLNLATTSRKLFVHRNTMIYRLDKIQKETGLDLRQFRDAVVFQLLMDMPEGSEIKEKEG